MKRAVPSVRTRGGSSSPSGTSVSMALVSATWSFGFDRGGFHTVEATVVGLVWPGVRRGITCLESNKLIA